MNPRSFILYFLIIAFWSCGGKKTSENEIVVFCASSLSPVMEQMKNEWEKNHEKRIVINSASTGILVRQIEHGAQADIFLSANREWMEYLINEMSIKNHPETIASNRLAVVVPLDVKLDSINFNELMPILLNQNSKISIGDPGHVPLGKYTKESLEYYRIYDDLSSELILAKDARNTLLLVELGEATFGFVYLSDAVSSKKVRIVSVIPEASHQRINYQVIIVNDENSKAMPAYRRGREFLDFLSAEETKRIWMEMGLRD